MITKASQAGGLETVLLQRRLELSSRPGVNGLLANPRTFLIALFASLGGCVYGYNQGMFGQVLNMKSFQHASGTENISNDDPTLTSFLTAILELGAWVGVLANGILADQVGRKMCVVIAVVFFCIGVVVQACTRDASYAYILGGRFVTGLGVGSLSMIVPLYNAELSPPEIRGALVSLQQLAITFGIMIAYWITYGTNFIGGTGETQSNASWLVPICIQLGPALILGIGIMFMPQSPRWLMDVGREDECLKTIAGLRRLPTDHALVQMEFLEVKAQKLFETRISEMDHPTLQDRSRRSNFMLGIKGYTSLISSRSNFKRLTVAVLIMVFQQWTGVNFILYYAPFIFQKLGLGGQTTSLLASGVVGVAMFIATVPAVLYSDKLGRKPLLIAGAAMMGICHFVVAIIIARVAPTPDSNGFVMNQGAGWAAVVFIWLFAIAFGFSWGPCAWVLVAEVFPLGLRAKGVSIGASSNWLNNFAVGMSTYNFVSAAPYGAYIFLGIMCALAVGYVWFFVPETKNRTLDEIDELFGDSSGRSKLESKMLTAAYHDVGLLDVAGVDKSEAPIMETLNQGSDQSHSFRRQSSDIKE